MWDRARTWKSAFADTMRVIRKRHAMAFHGFWCTVSAFRPAPKLRERSGITNQDEVAMNSTGWTLSAVAAATGRGFKSRRPDF
jgi:hypothetical protein